MQYHCDTHPQFKTTTGKCLGFSLRFFIQYKILLNKTYENIWDSFYSFQIL